MKPMFFRAVSGILIFVVSGATEPLLAQVETQQQQQQPAGSSTVPPIELPENPGRNSTAVPRPPSQSQAHQNSSPQQGTKQPGGTAIAPAPKASGGAASKPAGVALAPPRQRQVRSWLIRFGFIAGAGAALGTVAALSAASPGHVPGAPSH